MAVMRNGGEMARLEDLTKGALIRGLLPDRSVKVVETKWHGSAALTLTYSDEGTGKVDQELLYREDEPRLEIEAEGQAFSLDADGRLFRLVSEAKRIDLAHLFDPFLAVQTSNLDPLPHQIEAVYEKMLPRQPMRFLLADDPGAGKTIMAGLFCKELMIRGDVERCLIIAPGSLVEQWQDELWQKFNLEFTLLTREMIESSRSGNPFAEQPLLIARLDHLARREDLQEKLEGSDWDLVVVDEAHKMSAQYSAGEVRETKRYKLGRLAGSVSRHFLLMTATPHAGIDENFQLFMALLDADRFEGKPRGAAHTMDTADMMRRLVKEKLLKFDGTKLFPERRAYTASYPLSAAEAYLYEQVTDYVRDQMNQAEKLKGEGEGRRGNVVGFALTALQRRLASSPEAIYQSLGRRKKRLSNRLSEERVRKQGGGAGIALAAVPDEFRDDDFDPDDLPEVELEELEEEMVDQASAARTIAELEHEIQCLDVLESLARKLRASGVDAKWQQLSSILQDVPEMFNADGSRRKIIIFSEHRDTLNYLVDKLRTLFGNPDAVVSIHGGMPRDARRKQQEAFTQDKEVIALVATDAAGEGINLQRAHLMVNYDLPWNPNRLEQRFGRVHRIGQTEVCHLWNLVAADTREGQVFERLFEKLEEQRKALGDQVFDVLGEAFQNRSLRELLIEAVQYGDDPLVRARLNIVVDATVGDTLKDVVQDRALVHDVMTSADVERIRDEMERAEARKLQPHFVRAFFEEAFALIGGAMREREPGRFEITSVPAVLRRRDRQIGLGAPLLRRYERVTFEKGLITADGKPRAEFVTPGHPLLSGTLDLIIERYESLLCQGAVLVDESDLGEEPRALVYLSHAVVDGRTDVHGNRRTVSKRFEFVEIDRDGKARSAGWAPYLDCRPAAPEEVALLGLSVVEGWTKGELETQALDHGVELSRVHLEEVRRRTVDRVDKTAQQVRSRLLSEIEYWDNRANQMAEREAKGQGAKGNLNSRKARQRADELQARLRLRTEQLDAERQLSSQPPVVVGGAIVVPLGMLKRAQGESAQAVAAYAADRTATERAAVDAVMAAEQRAGRSPKEMPPNNKGYDIESKDPDGNLWFIEVKGRIAGADTFTITRSEIGVGCNKTDRHILALVAVDGARTDVRYVERAFEDVGNLPFDTVSVNLKWNAYFERGARPA